MSDDVSTWIGWSAATVLALTVGSQVWKQLHDPRTEGVSRMLFLGQTLASTLFLIYALMGGDRVFVVSNALMLALAIAGQIILMRNRRRASRGSGSAIVVRDRG